MTTTRLDVVCQDMKSFTALSEILVAAKQHSLPNQTSMKMKWPLTGGVPDGTPELSAEKPQSGSPQKNGSETQANMQSENTQDKVEATTTIKNSYFGKKESSLVLFCYESELSLHSLNCMIEGSTKYTLKTGNIELRSLPTLEMLGESSLMSILRWNLKTDMEKTIGSSSNGQTILVYENEAAFLSLFPCENELWSPESCPSLHDEVSCSCSRCHQEHISPKWNLCNIQHRHAMLMTCTLISVASSSSSNVEALPTRREEKGGKCC
ncbi:hypothetical protein KIW84_074421 [Lathyrus oleraceus]|uniref:Uncharacterized protein n=1 Tax=Pisum sativum TaxID=3888 RepID=A0A9D5A0H9_PEA|nr:hypothetical protein KIW84_074421 [Pisum sativum]